MLKQLHMTYRPFDSMPLAGRPWPEARMGGSARRRMYVPLGAIAVPAITALT
jgi:hypothetical protein